MKVDGYYDCILIYSVLMYLDSYEEKSRMIQKACNLLKHGGRMLVGDIVNVSVKERLANSKVGQGVDAVYRENIRMMTDEDKIKSENILPANYILVDRELCNLLYEIRSWGYESFLLPQDYRLPFGYSRQDILIKRW